RRPELAARLVNDGDTLRTSDLPLSQHPPATKRNAQGAQIIGTDQMQRDPTRLRLGLAIDSVSGLRSAEGQPAVAYGGGLQAGQVPGALQQFPGKAVALFQRRVAVGSQR